MYWRIRAKPQGGGNRIVLRLPVRSAKALVLHHPPRGPLLGLLRQGISRAPDGSQPTEAARFTKGLLIWRSELMLAGEGVQSCRHQDENAYKRENVRQIVPEE
jgi:hypothetical protein